MMKPEFITLEELTEQLDSEGADLTGEDRAWWMSHRVEPFVVTGYGQSHYAVAVSGGRALIFFDDEDEFGMGVLGPGGKFDEMGLSGDLVDAVRGLAAQDRRDN